MTRNLSFEKNGQLLSLLGTREKYYSFPIRVVNFCETFCTCSPSSLGQDYMVIFSFGLLELGMAVLDVF
jgi:hypothetical protein